MIPFKPMLAKDADLTKIGYPIAGQIKYDGIRATVIDGVLVSRTLKPIPNREIQAALGNLAALEGLDGELIVGDPADADCYRRTTSFVMAPNKTGEPWSFMVFDDVTRPERPYAIRRHAVMTRVARFHYANLPVFVTDERILHSEADLDQYEADALAVGHEGIILRDLAAPYKFGRSGKAGPLLKVKRFIDFEAEVVGVYEEMHNGNEATTNALGRTQRSSHAAGKVGKDRLGGYSLRALNGPCAGIEFRCGTGFTADQRRDLWTERDALVGRTVVVKSFPIGVKQAPRHPVWKGFRDLSVDG